MPVEHTQDPWTRVTTVRGYAADELISALQKSIRRGDVRLAMLVGRELYETSAELEAKMWSRLSVISCEDVGDGSYQEPVVINALFEMHERMDRAAGDRWLFLVHAIRYLAERSKDRTSDEWANLVTHLMAASERPFEVPEYAIDVHTRRGQESGRSVDEFWADGAHLENERPGRDTSVLDEILRIRAAGEWAAP
jgi:replication-associated recombination protein RarA